MPRITAPHARKKTASSFGGGSLVQWLGVLCWVGAFLMFLLTGTINLLMMLLGVVGIIIVIAGGFIGAGFECSECGTKVSRQDVKVCPGCKVRF